MRNLLLLLSILAITFSCKKKEDPKPADPVIVTPTPTPVIPKDTTKPVTSKPYYTFRIEAVSDADVEIRYAVSKTDYSSGKIGQNLTYSLKESKEPYPRKTITIEDTILKRNALSSTVHNKLITDATQITYKIFVDGILRYESKSNHVVYDISAGTIK